MDAGLMRVWRGWTKRSDADAYERYLRETGFAELSRTDGNRGVYLLRRDVGDNTEFVVQSLWDSLDAVKAFAGEDPEKAVYYPEDDRYLLGKDPVVRHYTIFEST